MTQDEFYNNWCEKVRVCGFTAEQACGLAITYALRQGFATSDEESADPQRFWKFIREEDYHGLIASQLTREDHQYFVPEIRGLAQALQVSLPTNRKDSAGNPTDLLNFDSGSEGRSDGEAGRVLSLSHRISIIWLQRAGERLRDEIRTPHLAYGFGLSFMAYMRSVDPDGFLAVLGSLFEFLSPLAKPFTLNAWLEESGVFSGWEPCQVGLVGFVAGIGRELEETHWNLQRVLIYEQREGLPTNLDKQYLPTTEFVDYAVRTMRAFVSDNHQAYLPWNQLIGSEFLYSDAEPDRFEKRFRILMESRFGWRVDVSSDDLPTTILRNVVASFTIANLLLKNLTNRIDLSPSLKMLDREGLFWTQDHAGEESLMKQAIKTFDVMLSWRSGPASALFLEDATGRRTIVYVGESSDKKLIESLYVLVCEAFLPVRCVLCYPVRQDGDLQFLPNGEMVIFLNAELMNKPWANFYELVLDPKKGFSLGNAIGHMVDSDYIENVLVTGWYPRVIETVATSITEDQCFNARRELIEKFDTIENWYFP